MAKSRSSEEKCAIVAASDMMSAVWQDLLAAVRERGGSGEDLYRLNTPEGKSTIIKLADVIVTNNGKRVESINYDTYSVPVDLTRTLAEMVAAGKYNYANPNIVEKNFPIQRPSVSEDAVEGGPYRTPGVQNTNTKIVLVHLNKVATTSEVLEYLDKLGLRPARIEELLALGEKFPDVQRQFPVVALGSVWVCSGESRRVAYLGGSGSGRSMSLDWDDPGRAWREIYRFPAVSK